MATAQRLFLVALLPLLVLLAVLALRPLVFYDAQTKVQAFSSGFGPDILPRSETPLIMIALASYSHYEKVAKMAVVLANLGYPITFITGGIFEEDAKKLHPNVEFYAMHGKEDEVAEEKHKKVASLKPGSMEATLSQKKKAMIEGIPETHDTLQAIFQKFKKEHGNKKPLISLHDSILFGSLLVLTGADGIRPDASIGLSPHPIFLDSNDTYPFYMAKSPHMGPDAQHVHQKANSLDNMDFVTRTITEAYWDILKQYRIDTNNKSHIYDEFQRYPDHIMLLGVPEFEHYRGDLRPNLHYFGALPRKNNTNSIDDLPSWWEDIAAAKKAGKKIIAVSQGTVETNLDDLLIPTIEALKDRNDILLIATTVATEVADIPNLVIPDNTRIAKFVPYDLLLPYVDILVNNGGYGAVIQSISLGIPMVVAGQGQDKDVTNVILALKELGENLGTRTPSIEDIREGVAKVLDDPKYKRNAVAMSKNFERYNISKVFDDVIQGEVRKWAKANGSR